MLKLNQFVVLGVELQCDLIRLKGNLLFKKFCLDSIKFLYSYNDYFIEVSYFENQNSISVSAYHFDYEAVEKFIDIDLFSLTMN